MSSKETIIKATVQVGMDISDVQSNAKAIQNALKNFKMPAGLGEQFEKTFKGLEAEITKVQTLIQSGFKTKSDVTGFEKSKKNINNLYNTLQNLYSSFKDESLMMNVDFNTDEIKQAKRELQGLKQQLSGKVETDSFRKLKEQIEQITSLSKSGAAKSLQESFTHLNLDSAREDLNGIVAGLGNFARGGEAAKTAAKNFQNAWNSGNLKNIEEYLKDMPENMKKVAVAAIEAKKGFDQMGNTDIGKINTEINELSERIGRLENIQVNKMEQSFDDVGNALSGAKNHAEQFGDAISNSAQDMYSFNGQMEQIKHRVQDFFSLTNSVMLFRRAVQQAFETVKELDAAMTETAVVTDFNVGDMWDQLPRYTQAANDLGTTTLGAYETMTLFYQQGLETNEVFEIGTETMKMARIAGLEYKDATDLMTAALRGFNMELNEMSAARVNDVYSELAAITAADTQEIATAMTKTASIAANANMEFETTAAFLSQIIETTREPAETAGTAMKTIIARFTEMKKAESDLVDVDGETVSVNKVEAALKTAGVALRDFNGEFRDTDDVFLELASKWNGLDKMTQRYIATMAAGSRQQSRFIAMMSDYDRTVELVDAAYSSSGASQKQFEKTQDSLESKINKLKNAWNEFLMGISNSKVIKAGVDALTGLLNVINKLTGNSGLLKLGVAIGALKGGKAIFEGLFRSFAPFGKKMGKNGAEAGVSFLKGLTQKLNNFKQGKGLLLDVDIDTKGFKNKINNIKIDLQGLKHTFTERVEVFDPKQMADANVGISSISNSMKTLVVEGELAGETVEHSLSEVGIKAILAAEGIEEGSEEAAEFSVEASVAIEAVEKQYEDLIAKAMAYQAVAEGTDVDVDIDLPDIGDISKKDAGKKATELFDQVNDLSKDKQALKKMQEFGSKSGMTYKNALEQSVKNLGTKIGGTVTTGLSKFASLFGATGAAAGAAYAGAILAAVAVVAGTIYAMWYNSGLQVSKRLAEAQAATLEDTRAQTDALTTQVRELDDAWEKLTTGQEELDGMVQGTIEWTQKVQELNTEVQALLEKYPELYKYLEIDQGTGQWSLNEAGYKTYEQKQSEELNELKNRELYEQAMSNYSTATYEAMERYKNSNEISDQTKTEDELNSFYKNTLSKAYYKAHGEAAPSDMTMTELAQDQKTRALIGNMTEDDAEELEDDYGEWTMGNAIVALKYADDISKAEQQLKAEEDAYVRNYMASQGTYGASIQEAVAQTMYDLPSMYEQLEQDRSDAGRDRWWSFGGYDGKTGGAGAKMQGEGNKSGRSVQQIMEDRGYELVDKGKNYYRNKYTGEYVNVDAIGGGAAGGKKKKKKVNGEEVEMETWSNEYVRDIGRQDELRRIQEQNMRTLANAFAADKNLAKLASGDLSADVSKIKTKSNITRDDGTVLFDYETKENEFKKNRDDKMTEMNKRYGNVFKSTGKTEKVTVDGADSNINTYSQATYEAAQATVEFENSVSGMGATASAALTSTFLALTDLQNKNSELELNTVMDSTDASTEHIRQMVGVLDQAGVSASELKDYVGTIDMTSAINGARQLKQDLEEGGEKAAMAATVLGADQAGAGIFSLGNQFKELMGSEQWLKETSKGLSEIYQMEGKITSDNIRELAKENKDLAAVLDTNSLKASGFAKMMEAVEEGTIDVTDVTEDLIKIYDGLYYSADLAGEAIARLESAKIGDSDTKVGNIYSESWAAVQDLLDRGAYGDSQIDDYMAQMVGEATWNNALTASGGNKQAAANQINKTYGLDENNGNLHGSWQQMLKTNGPVGNGAITLGADGQVNYDLSKVKSTQQLVNEMVKGFGITREHAETMLGDLKTYSKTLGEDLSKLDAAGTEDKFLDSRTIKDGNKTILNATDAELSAFAKARGQSLEDYKKTLTAEGTGISEIQARKTSQSGYYYTDEEGNAKWTDSTAKSDSQTKSAEIAAQAAKSVDITTNFVDSNGTVVNQDYLNNLLASDDRAREIILDPSLDEDQKEAMLTDLYANVDATMGDGTANGIAKGLLSETSQTNAATYSQILGDSAYNEMGGALTQAMALMAEAEIFLPMGASLPIKIPEIDLGPLGKVGGGTFDLLPGTLGGITIGGETVGGAKASATFGGGAFQPRNNTYKLVTVDTKVPGGGATGGTGTGYSKGDDEENGANGGNSGGGGEKEENNTDPHVVNAEKRLEALDRRLERREIDAVEYKLEQDKLYQEKKVALEAQKKAEEKEAEYLDEYYKYDSETDAYLYLEDAYNKASDETKNKIDEEINKLQDVNDELNEIEDAIEDLEFRDPADEERYYRAEGDKMNAETDLAHIERQRAERERYGALVGKLPSEVQGPLNMGLLGMDMMYEAQEIQVNQGLQASLEDQLRSKYNDSDFAGEYYIWDERTQSFKIDSDKIANTVHDETTRGAIFDEFNAMQDLVNSWKEVTDELSGGVITEGMRSAGKALKAFAKEVKDSDFDDGYLKVETGFKALDEVLNNLADKLENSELVKDILSTKILPGLNINEEQGNKLFSNKMFADFVANNPALHRVLMQLLGDQGVQLGTALGAGADMAGGIAEIFGGLNFDMMEIGLDMFNGAKGMVDQISSKIEEVIGYITQATQVIIDAWTNREDYLYNFLKVIEKHLQEYEKLQRYSTQLEKGRLSSSQDILNNWNERWKSLQLQLEEQQERLETRQDELNRSRWNPFMLISGWDPTSDTLYENREVKFLWDVIIGLGEAFAPFGTGAFFSQLNQLYEDYDSRVQQSYEDRLAAEQALLDLEDERLELVKVGADEATEFEQKLLDAMIQKEQEQIDELTRLNEAITDANSKLISTLQNNLEKMRQDRENEKKEEELGEKERRLAYLRQDTSGANMMEIKKLEEELEEGHEDYTDTLIDQKISELEKQNELAAEQRQQQIDLLQGQLDYAEKYGLYWDAIYGMLYTIDENGNAILNPENFDLDGNIRENSELAKMLNTFSDRLGMSVWSSVLDNEETKRLGRYYGAFIGMNGVDGDWANYWALKDPGADDPNYSYPEQEIPDGLLGVLYKLEIGISKYFGNSNLGLVNGAGRAEQALKNFFGKIFGIEDWANYEFTGFNPAHTQAETMGSIHEWELGFAERSNQRWNKLLDLFDGDLNNKKAARTGQQTTEKAKSNMNNYGTQNYGAVTENYNFNIGTVGESISLDDMVEKVSSAIKGLFTSDGVGSLQKKR